MSATIDRSISGKTSYIDKEIHQTTQSRFSARDAASKDGIINKMKSLSGQPTYSHKHLSFTVTSNLW